MGKWTGLEKPITQKMAESEPEAERLFSLPRRPLHPDVAALIAGVDQLSAKYKQYKNRRETS